jgi:HD-GYP domain-containing protein (c-di-GMP phosphodiesterase class II)
MADFYNFEHKDKITFLIAASMLNFGKLSISNSIIEKTTSLDTEEYDDLKANVYNNKKALSSIYGFEDISKWASKHHEMLNSNGYPYSIGANELSLKDRLMGCLNIYNALTSIKVYRKEYSHSQAIDIMYEMATNNEIDLAIVNDINTQFKE